MSNVNTPLLNKIGFFFIGLLLLFYGIIFADLNFDIIDGTDLYRYMIPITLGLSAFTFLIGIAALGQGGNRTSAMVFMLISIPFLFSALPTYVSNFPTQYSSYVFLAVGAILFVLSIVNAATNTKTGALISFLISVTMILMVLPIFFEKASAYSEYIFYTITAFFLIAGLLCVALGIAGRSSEVIKN